MSETADQFVQALDENASLFEVKLSESVRTRLRKYYEIVQAWNALLHLVAPCSPEEFAVRHVLESLLAIKYMPSNAHVVDIGSGAGFPIIPCLISRRDIRATLIESSNKKTVFLREALKTTDASDRAGVLASRFEDLPASEAGVVTCRALDRFTSKLPSIIEWSAETATLILFGGSALRAEIEKFDTALLTERIPKSEKRFVFVIKKHRIEETS
jgi:16S rRNA (guanine527-N7)-methyltransferase